MKTIETIEKKSLISKLIDAFKNTAFYNIFLNENSGLVVDPNEIDPEEQISYLADVSGCSREEIKSIEAAFKQANERMEPLVTKVSSIPQESKNSANPFRVNDSDLNHDILTSQVQKAHDAKDRELGE